MKNHGQSNVYAGLYQAYAYDQGFHGTPVTFRVPDEYLCTADGEPFGFRLEDFMFIASELDEAAIHLWHITNHNGRQLTLVCTEDYSMRGLDADAYETSYTIHKRLETDGGLTNDVE